MLISSGLLILGLVSLCKGIYRYYSEVGISTNVLFTSENIPSHETMFQVALVAVMEVEYTIFCGGSIISAFYVLSSAACFLDDYSEYSQAEKFVSLDPDDLTNPRYTREVRETIMHEKFNININLRLHDIVLLRLFEPFLQAASVRYAIMPRQNENITAGTSVRVFRIGRKRSADNPLQVLQDRLTIEHTKCKTSYRNLGFDVYNTTFCAYNERVRLCAVGEIGSGIVDEKKKLIGLVTYPLSLICTKHYDVPPMFTRVSSHIDWIERHISSRKQTDDYSQLARLRFS